jgi:hypothetical protein
MKGDALYRIIGGIVLVVFAVAVPLVKFHDSRDIVAALSADILLPIGCLAIALLGVLVSAAGFGYLKKIGMMTRLIGRMVREQSHVITKEIAGAVGLHETEVRERVDEMIKERTIPTGTRITYVGGEKVVK